MRKLKNYYPVIILFVCCYLYSLNFLDRLVFIHNDEAWYSTGLYKFSNGWSPLYLFYYSFLNNVTNSVFDSLYYNYLLLTYFIIPIATYLTLRNLKFEIESSAFAAFLALISYWNYPLETKIQNFNYVFLLIAFNFRCIINQKYEYKYLTIDCGKILYYSTLGLAMFIRHDNIILVASSLFWDFRYSLKKISVVSYLATFTIFYLLLRAFLGNPHTDYRGVEALLDHFSFNNEEVLHGSISSGENFKNTLRAYFNYPKTIKDIFIAQPTSMANHLIKNFFWMFKKLPLIFSLHLEQQWNHIILVKIIIVLLTISTFSKAVAKKAFNKINIKEIKFFTFVICIKCVAISMLLNWWIRYFFEIQIIAFIWLMVGLSFFKNQEINPKFNLIISNFKNLISLKKRNYFNFLIWSCLPLIFFFYNYDLNSTYEEKGLHQLVVALKDEHQVMPIKNAIVGSEPYLRPPIDYQVHDLYFNEQKDSIGDLPLSEYLSKYKIDTVIMYDKFRTMIHKKGINQQFEDFEANCEKYGFELKYANERRQIIYRIKNQLIISDNKNAVK